MKTKLQITLFTIIAFGLFSCSMVKNPQSANFNRVKYNSHLKFAKNEKQKSLPKTVSSFEKKELAKGETPNDLEKTKLELKEFDLESLTASTNTATRTALRAEKRSFHSIQLKSKKPIKGLFINDNNLAESNISNYLNAPMAAAEELALGNVLYILLVLLGILLVVAIVSEFTGGLIGLIIALLLILLLLRLLEIV